MNGAYSDEDNVAARCAARGSTSARRGPPCDLQELGSLMSTNLSLAGRRSARRAPAAPVLRSYPVGVFAVEAPEEPSAEEAEPHAGSALPLASLSLALCGPTSGALARRAPRKAAAASASSASVLPLPRHAAAGRPVSALAGGASSAVCFRTTPGVGLPPPPPSDSAVHTSSALWPAVGAGAGEPRGAGGLLRASVVWFRSDLRLHDHDALARATAESSSVAPVYIFDPRDYGKSASGFDKTGPYRAQFLLECVADLRAALAARGSTLLVRIGRPEEILPQLCADVGASAVYCHTEVTYEELQLETAVCAALKRQRVALRALWGATLYHLEDLPFALADMPSNYGGFRERVQGLRVRAALAAPERLKGLPPTARQLEHGAVPTLAELGLARAGTGGAAVAGAEGLLGGESEALARLGAFIRDAAGSLAAAARGAAKGAGAPASAEGLSGANFSCKISPWLALGCLSPRRMYEDLTRAAQATRQAAVPATATAAAGGAPAAATADASGLNWLVFELLWRDFFRFITRKYGATRGGPNPAGAAAVTASATPAMALA